MYRNNTVFFGKFVSEMLFELFVSNVDINLTCIHVAEISNLLFEMHWVDTYIVDKKFQLQGMGMKVSHYCIVNIQIRIFSGILIDASPEKSAIIASKRG